MSITKTEYDSNVTTIEQSRYGSEMRIAIAENFDYLKTYNGYNIVKCTQNEYDSMDSHQSNTLYLIVEGY